MSCENFWANFWLVWSAYVAMFVGATLVGMWLQQRVDKGQAMIIGTPYEGPPEGCAAP